MTLKIPVSVFFFSTSSTTSVTLGKCVNYQSHKYTNCIQLVASVNTVQMTKARMSKWQLQCQAFQFNVRVTVKRLLTNGDLKYRFSGDVQLFIKCFG